MESRNRSLQQMLKTSHSEPRMGAEYGSYGDMTQAPRVETMTLDAVIIRTVGLLGLAVVAAFVTWSMAEGGNPETAYALGTVGMFIGLGAMLFSMFKPVTSAPIAVIYCAGKGLMLGAVSSMFNHVLGGGVIVNALMGTLLVFVGMLLLYKNRIIRNSPKFTKVIVGMGAGIFLLLMVNLVSSLFGANLGLLATPGESGTLLQWGIVLAMVGFAAFSFILDFDMIEQGIASGAPKKYAWAGAFGLAAGVIFLYWTMLQLMALIQGGD